MTMGQEDVAFRLKEQKKLQRKLAEACRTEKAEQTKAAAGTVTQMSDDEENQTGISSSTNDEFPEISQYHRRQTNPSSAVFSEASVSADTPVFATSKLNRRRLIDDPLFVASLDRTQTTPRQAMHIVVKGSWS